MHSTVPNRPFNYFHRSVSARLNQRGTKPRRRRHRLLRGNVITRISRADETTRNRQFRTRRSLEGKRCAPVRCTDRHSRPLYGSIPQCVASATTGAERPVGVDRAFLRYIHIMRQLTLPRSPTRTQESRPR